MNSKYVRSVLAIALFSVFASLAVAGPGPEYWQRVKKAEEFAKLKAGDKVLYVCNQCQTVTEKTIASTAEAMEHCKEGATLTCPSCESKVKVTFKAKQNRNDSGKVTEVVYTNDKGEECFFIAKK